VPGRTRGSTPARRIAGGALAAAAGLLLWLLWQWLLLAPVAARASPAAVAGWAVAVGAAFLCFAGGRLGWNRRLRVHSRLRPPPAAGATLALLPPLLLLLLSLTVLLLALELAVPDVYPEALMELLARSGGGAVFLLLAVGVIPVLEEVGFRGWVQRPLEPRIGPRAAILATAVVFALAHVGSSFFPARLAGGVVLGAAVHATRSVWTGIVLHAGWNGGMLVLAAAAPGWDPSGAGWGWAAPAAAGAVLGAAGCAYGVRRLRAAARGTAAG
jgi:membrane protease YdiL (CAAX protease family)